MYSQVDYLFFSIVLLILSVDPRVNIGDHLRITTDNVFTDLLNGVI